VLMESDNAMTDELQRMRLVWMNCEEAPHVHVLWEPDRVGDSGAADRDFLPPRPVNKLILESRPVVPIVKRLESEAVEKVTCCQGRLLQLHVACRPAYTLACGVPCQSYCAGTKFTFSCLIRSYNHIYSHGKIHYRMCLALAVPHSRSSGGVSNPASLLGTLDPASFLETCQVIVCMMMFS
jgi:hypothetical protein